jgi:arginine-tRNA-protein transferase
MNLLKEFSLKDKCSYLDNKTQSTHYKMIENCSREECQDFIERGYRRFGKMFFHPICADCQECQSIKIDVQNYQFTKSARRILKKAKNIKSYLQTPTISQTHIDLFTKYHLYMKDKKEWAYNEITPEYYYQSFVDGHHDFGYEVLYFHEGKLIGVDLIDILDNGISSIYFYYDPDYASYSLGKLSLYKQIEFAKKSKRAWIYLGYYVQECPSLSYKAQYKPFKTLEGRPKLNEAYCWS